MACQGTIVRIVCMSTTGLCETDPSPLRYEILTTTLTTALDIVKHIEQGIAAGSR